ncbi:peptidylprolyl isomerase [Pseudomonas sp. Marseille-QA0892]
MACSCGNAGGRCQERDRARPDDPGPRVAGPTEHGPTDRGPTDRGPTAVIARSEDDWPVVRVNGVEIPGEAIAAELQYHPADDRHAAAYQAVTALVVRELLRQRAEALGIAVESGTPEVGEEAITRRLIEREVAVPQADDAAIARVYEANPQRFRTAPLVAARHILLACAPDDALERSTAMEQARELIDALCSGASFEALAAVGSDCPSRRQGGVLGQLSKGQTVPEFERQLFRLPEGLCERPLESRYGVHVVIVDQRIEGQALPLEAVRESIREELNGTVWRRAVAGYISTLVGAARIEGIAMEGAASPLVQ